MQGAHFGALATGAGAGWDEKKSGLGDAGLKLSAGGGDGRGPSRIRQPHSSHSGATPHIA
jgi:hypothetical protein